MRFREEVLAKIFTYITVAVLLGIVAFEAWGLSRERSRRKDAEDNAAVLQEEVENMRDINSTLKKENGELSAFCKGLYNLCAVIVLLENAEGNRALITV